MPVVHPTMLLDRILLVLLLAVMAVALVGALLRRPGALSAVRTVGRAIHCPAYYPLFLFFILIVLSALLTERNMPGSFRHNMGCLYDAWGSIFVFLPLGLCIGKSSRQKGFFRFLTVFAVAYSIFVLYGLLAVIFPETLGAPGIYMLQYRLNFWNNPNTTGMMCGCLLVLAVPLFLYGGRTARILLSCGSVLLYTALMLTDSRTAILSAAVSLIAAAILLAFRSRKRRLLKGILGVLAVVLLLFGGQKAFSPVRMAIAEGNPADISQDTDVTLDDVQRPMLESTLNERSEIWSYTAELLKNNPDYALHGCSPYKGPELIGEHMSRPLYTHNQLLEIALGYGIPSAGVFLLWLLWLALRSLRVGMGVLKEKTPLYVSLLPLVLLMLVINNMAEAKLLFYSYPVGAIFFLLAGYVLGVSQSLRTGEKLLPD